MRITVVGAGYVGLTTGAALAYLGHDVVVTDKDQHRLLMLRQGLSPIHEPGLQELLHAVSDNIEFLHSTCDAVADSQVIIVAVGTPSQENSRVDTRFVETAVREVAQGLVAGRTYTLIIKSTVPVGSNRRVAHVVNAVLVERCVNAMVYCVANPEFLREGMALRDTLYPDRIVVGVEQSQAADSVLRMYRPILDQTFMPPSFVPRPEGFESPACFITEPTSAEMIKYAANAFLALKISFINEIAGLCERVGADVTQVAAGIGLDRRIGHRFLSAGLGWGGSCFPKDTAALVSMASDYGYTLPIVQASREVNVRQRQWVIERLQATLKVLRGRIVGVLGLAFKPNTDDVREAPGLGVVRLLLEQGVHVRVHDPVAMDNARLALEGLEVEYVNDPYETAQGCDALVLVTEWDLYVDLDLRRLGGTMRTRLLVDGRNLFSPEEARQAGFTYYGVGR